MRATTNGKIEGGEKMGRREKWSENEIWSVTRTTQEMGDKCNEERVD